MRRLSRCRDRKVAIFDRIVGAQPVARAGKSRRTLYCTLVAVGWLASLAVMSVTSARAAQAETKLHYEIHLGGIYAGAVDVGVDLSETRYVLSAVTRSAGLIDVIIGFVSRARSNGAFAGGFVRPIRHSADNIWMGEDRWVRADYDEGRNVTVKVHPQPAVDGRDSVPTDVANGAFDPLSAALHAVGLVRTAKPCEGVVPVFDGRRRYDLIFTHVGGAPMATGAYKGMTRHCRVSLRRIAGFSRHPWLPVIKGVETVDVWFAELRASLPEVPILLEADTGLGTVVFRLVKNGAGDAN